MYVWRKNTIESPSERIDRIVSKSHPHTLRFIRHYTTETLRIRLIQSLVIPHIDYCSTMYLDTRNSLKARLRRLSKSGLRYIFEVHKDTHIIPYRKKLG